VNNKKRTLTQETLDLLEDRMLKSMLGELDNELPAATLEIFRKVLNHNGRLSAPMSHFKGDDFGDDIDDEDVPPIALHYTKDGTVVVDIELYSDTIGWNSFLAVRADGATKYAQLDSNLSHTYASDLRVRQDGTTYAVLTEEGTPT